MIRVYIPATLSLLRQWLAASEVRPLAAVAFAVTDALRRQYPDTDEEELEFLALSDAARASLRLLSADAATAPDLTTADGSADAGSSAMMRVVVAADVPEVTEDDRSDRAAVRLAGPVRWKDVASVHLDGADVAEVVRQAAAAVDAADLGDLDAEFVVGEAESHYLAWYAPGEVRYLLDEID